MVQELHLLRQELNAIGVDVNGLSVLLSQVKATSLSQMQFSIIESFIEEMQGDIFKWKLSGRPKIKVKEIEGQDHWFQKNVSEEISFLLNKISEQSDAEIKNFLKIVLSSIIVRVSNQDSDTRDSHQIISHVRGSGISDQRN